MLKLYLVTLLFVLGARNVLHGQNTAQDTTAMDTIKKPFSHHKKAALYSALLPGAGQVYNHLLLPKSSRRKWNAYWKLPLIYGAIGGSTYMLISKQQEIGNLKKEYKFRMGIDGGASFEIYQNLDAQAVLQIHNQAQTQRDLFILTTVLAYAINVLDAVVEAHFINFDVSDDISMAVQPSASNLGLGISLAMTFK